MKTFFAFLTCIIFINNAFAQDKKTYYNDRYYYSIEYPKEFIAQGESDSKDGQSFIRKDKKARLTVCKDFREFLFDNINIAKTESFKEDCQSKDGKIITYKKEGSKFYVISGTIGNIIFYQKTIISSAGLVTAYIEYDKSLSSIYNDYCTYLFNTFK